MIFTRQLMTSARKTQTIRNNVTDAAVDADMQELELNLLIKLLRGRPRVNQYLCPDGVGYS